MKRSTLTIIVIVILIVIAIIYFLFYGGNPGNLGNSGSTATEEEQSLPEDDLTTGDDSQSAADSEQAVTDSEQAVTDGEDLVIQVADITEKAKFYPYQGPDYEMEVFAVKASDGTIRTAFNTCQVCYSSGRGYYEQEGNVLVCQNCGNRFGVDDIEVIKGGCNPVPITEEYKTEDADTITIPGEFMKQAQVIFSNWKI